MSALAWQQVVYLCTYVFGVLLMASKLGEPRDPYDGADLSFHIVIGALFVWMVLSI